MSFWFTLTFVFYFTLQIADVLSRVFKPAIMQRAGVAFDLPIVEAYYKAQKVHIHIIDNTKKLDHFEF